MKQLLFITLFFLSFQASAEQWLCVTERMTGFYLDEKTNAWEPGTFTDRPKYIISSYPEAGIIKYTVKEHASNNEFPTCQDFVNKQDEYFITCQDKYGSSFLFNKTRNRFQFSNVIGGFVYPYLKGTPPFMSIGLCSSF